MLPIEIWRYIAESVEYNKDKCQLMMTCKEISDYQFFFNEQTLISRNKIKSRWFDRFTNIITDKIESFPLFMTHLTFYKYFNMPITSIKKEKIKNKLKFIEKNAFYTHISGGKPEVFYIPLSVTHLTLSADFNQPINKNSIPSSVTHLTFGYEFNQPINECIPSNMIHLTFGHDFNQPIKGSIPPFVKFLQFGTMFNQSIKNNIPSSVTHLIFGHNFNRSIKNSIPDSVTHLTFGYRFNHSIENNIPSSVIYLKFEGCFNQSINNIPRSITHLTLGRFFNQPINLDHKLKYIKLSESYNYPFLEVAKYTDELAIPRNYDFLKHYFSEHVEKIHYSQDHD